MAKNQQAGLRQSMKASREDSLTGDGVFSLATLDLRFARQKTLDPRVTHTRASSGTYVGSDGVLRSAVTNLLLRSEEFDNAAWTPGSIPAAVTANNAIAPNGTLTADLITGVSAAADQLQQVVTVLNSTVYTYSIYIKQNTTLLTRIGLFNATASTWMGAVDIAWAAGVPSTSSTIGSPSNISYVAVGDGWYRCSFTTTTTTASTQIHFHPDRNNTQASAWIWGAQLEQSSTVGEYVPTTSTINSAPRFDHDPVTGESLGLLVEEARTNLLQQSETFDNAYWTKARASVSANTVVSPDGMQDADSLIEDATASNTHLAFSSSVAVSTATIYTYTIYAKEAGRTWFVVQIGTGAEAYGAAVPFCFFNLSNGTLGASGSCTPSITSVGNGWYRCVLVAVATTAATTTNMRIKLADLDSSDSYTGNGTSGIYIWGAQLEAGAFPTSYIPTVAATATRAADVASITGSNFSSWYRQDEGTNLIEFRETDRTGTRTPRSLSDGTASNRIDAFLSSSLTVNNRLAIAGVSYNPGNLTLSAAGTVNKHVASAAPGSAIAVTNGTLSTESAPPSLPVVNRIVIGADSIGGTPFTGTIRRITYWPTRLSNEVLQRITQ